MTATRKADHWIFDGCRHARAFVGNQMPFVANADRSEMETKWDAEAERLFGVYTYAWTEKARTVFQARLWPTPPPIVPTELFDARNEPVKPADIAAVKAWNESHPASREEDTGYF